jgi:hypothetical protein
MKIESRCRPPVPEQARLDVFSCKRLLEERVVKEIYLTDGEIVGGTPVGIYKPQSSSGSAASVLVPSSLASGSCRSCASIVPVIPDLVVFQ